MLYCAALVGGLWLIGAVPILILRILYALGLTANKGPAFKGAAGYGFVLALAIGFALAIFTNPVGFFLGGGGRASEALYPDE
jgi:hypothetical protein